MNFLIRAVAIAAMLHITPIVVLVKRPDAVQALLAGAGGGGRDPGPGRESRRLRGRRGGQRRRPGSCGVWSLLQSCEGLTGGASVTFSATAGGRRTSIWA